MTPGKGCLAMWWNMDAAVRPEFEHWHSHEHFPERLRIPGFERASRWIDAHGGDGVFVMYELASYKVLSSPAYLQSLNAPSPWSTRMMPHHRDMVRCQCHVLEANGGTAARFAATARLAPADGKQAQLRSSLAVLARDLAGRGGFAGGHLLQHEAPAIGMTTEQKIRGGEAAADWVFVATGYDHAAIGGLLHEELSADSLARMGASAEAVRGLYSLSYSAILPDVAWHP